MKLVSAAMIAAIGALAALPAAAQVIGNPSFETIFADPTKDPWQPAGAGAVDYVTSVSPAFGDDYAPTEGAQFALLTAGPDDQYEKLSQTFKLDKASIVTFDAAFIARDEFDEFEGGLQFNDDAYVTVAGHTIFRSNIEAVTSFGATPWTSVHIQLDPGTYTIEAGVENAGDVAAGGYQGGADSQLALDNFRVTTAPVPEPATWGLMIVGFAGLGAALRARRSAAVPQA